MNKAAFTLIELLLVIVLTMGLYGLFFANFNKQLENKKAALTLLELNSYMKTNFEFDERISFVCVDEGELCYFILDENNTKEYEVKNFFSSKPEVYTYSADPEVMEFESIEFENFENKEVVFEYSINRDNKSAERVVVINDSVYIMNSISSAPLVLKDLDEVRDLFESKRKEVKNAF